MRLFIDECLSPALAQDLNTRGHLAVHPLHYGKRGEPDHRVLQRCVDQDLVIVTVNAGDFRQLVARVDIHPGLITLPCVSGAEAARLLQLCIDFLDARGDAMSEMVNHVPGCDETGNMTLRPLPAS